MRIVVIGAGAIGGVVGARLFEAGHEVALVARGAHLAAIQSRGLRLDEPDRSVVLSIPAVASIAELPFVPDLAWVATKTQDVQRAIADLDPGVPVCCAQNGVESERIALRRMERVYGVLVWLPATHLDPGVVTSFATPPGVLDIGGAPQGIDPLGEAVAAALRYAGFLSEAREDILRWKYAKLLTNLGNALQAACGLDAHDPDLLDAAREEALACYAAAGIDPISEVDLLLRADPVTMRPVAGVARGGGSTWQSLARETGGSEVDYLNGEIALLGRLHGVPTPVNSALQRVVAALARDRRPAGSVSVDDLRAAAGW